MNSQTCPQDPESVPQLQGRFSAQSMVPEEVSTCHLCSGSCDSLYSLFCLSNLGGSVLPGVLPSLIDLRRVLDFSVQLFSTCQEGVELSISFRVELANGVCAVIFGWLLDIVNVALLSVWICCFPLKNVGIYSASGSCYFQSNFIFSPALFLKLF